MKHLYTGSAIVTKSDGLKDVVRKVNEKQKLFALLEIKGFDDKSRRFKGVASSATPDRQDDVVEPDGAEFKLPIPFLYQHDSGKPIGWIDVAKRVGKEWQIEGFVETPDADAPPTIVERLNVAYYELKKKLVRGLSIGFNPKEWSFIKETGGIHWLKWEWLELSMVTIAANADASILAIKSMANGAGAASGNSSPMATSSARAGANQSNQKGLNVKYTNEALAKLQDARQTKAQRMDELLELKRANGQFSDEERSEFTTLDSEIEDIDDEIRVAKRHLTIGGTAKAIDGAAHGSRGPTIIVNKNGPADKWKGQSYIRMLMAKSLAYAQAKSGDGPRMSPSAIAEHRWGKSNVVQILKANEVAGGGTGSGEWGAELVQINTQYTGDFIEYLYAKTVFDRLPLRQVPARARIKGQDGVSTGFWTGESKAIKVTTGDFSSVDTTPYKVGAIAVFSKELLEDSDPSVELLMRDSLEEGLRQRIDTTFLSATAVSAGVSPAGILNGLSAVAASNGPDEQSARTDYRALMAPFITAKNVGGFYWVTNPTLAVGLGSMVNALGQTVFNGLTAEGGTYMGYPMITGDNVGTGDILLLKPSDIWRIGDMGIQVQISDTAMIEQSSAPTGETDTPTAATATLTSMFQEDSVAIKVTRRVSFGKRRASAVAWIDDAAYGAENS